MTAVSETRDVLRDC